MDITRRNFIKSMIALGVVTAVPAPLIKAAEKLIEAPGVQKLPPVYLMLDGAILPISHDFRVRINNSNNRWNPPYRYRDNFNITGSILDYPAPEINILFFSNLELPTQWYGVKYVFELKSDAVPFDIKGVGHIAHFVSGPMIPNEEGQRFRYMLRGFLYTNEEINLCARM